MQIGNRTKGRRRKSLTTEALSHPLTRLGKSENHPRKRGGDGGFPTAKERTFSRSPNRKWRAGTLTRTEKRGVTIQEPGWKAPNEGKKRGVCFLELWEKTEQLEPAKYHFLPDHS